MVGACSSFSTQETENVQLEAELTKGPEVHTPTAQFLQPGPTFKGLRNFPKMPLAADKAFKTQETVGRTLYINRERLWYWVTHH